jgi:Cu(I)/Ag(I) efflux system membrane protein CusA/SilA
MLGRLGSEFMPPLDEGSILYMPTAPHGMAMAEASRVLQRMDLELRKVPEVASVFGKIGRADTATDPAPMGMAETVLLLKPRSEWRPGLSRDDLIRELDDKVRFPGMPNLWWMPIQTRTEMLSTGIRSSSASGVRHASPRSADRDRDRAHGGKGPGTRSVRRRSSGGFPVDVKRASWSATG